MVAAGTAVAESVDYTFEARRKATKLRIYKRKYQRKYYYNYYCFYY